ncbi:MAG TPA: Uma2 family endonuclease [Chloroflexia bacterium]|nr:Uma2 family endonuclease [Chloroflexia bacterium]
MAAPRHQYFYTPEEYLALERQAAAKSEYLAGQIVAMSGASRVHNRISVNLVRVLSAQTLDGPCETYSSDLRVKVSGQGLYTYPDLTVVCGPQQFEDDQVDTLLNPTLIVEVLSPSTEAYDRGAKFGYYRALPSLQEYLLVAQDQALLEHYLRADDSWVFTATRDPGAVVRLPTIACDLPLAEVYRNVIFPPRPEGAGPAPLDPAGARASRA